MDAAVDYVTQLAPSLIAIDGLPCSGKTTLAEQLGCQGYLSPLHFAIGLLNLSVMTFLEGYL